MTNLYAKALPAPKPKRLPRKCSTCAGLAVIFAKRAEEVNKNE